MVSSGTEAAMSALRVARGYTGRDKIIKFEGCYHGHARQLFGQGGLGAITFGIPTAPGFPLFAAEHTLVAPYKRPRGGRGSFRTKPLPGCRRCVEPIAGNMGVVLPKEGFLKGLEELCRKNSAS